MIKINGLAFVEKPADAVATLFAPIDGKTAAGFYKADRRGVMFYGLDGEPFAFACRQTFAPFFVTASIPPGADGAICYRYALSERDAARLGFVGSDDKAECAGALSVCQQTLDKAGAQVNF